MDAQLQLEIDRPLSGEGVWNRLLRLLEGRLGREAVRNWLATLFEFMPDFCIRIDVLAHDGANRYLARDTYSGEGADAFGAAETEWYVVDQLRDGKLWREDIFADEAAARQVFAHQCAIS